jgi:hypothetical protein
MRQWTADLLADESADFEDPATAVPVPGQYYRIQYGEGGLLTTAGRAYGVAPGAERLRLAQKINNHPLNRTFWVQPTSAFNREFFPRGIIHFRAGSRLWIPPREDAIHQRLGAGTAYPTSLLRAPASGSGSPDLCEILSVDPKNCPPCGGDRRQVGTTGDPPYKWSCFVRLVYLDPGQPGRIWVFSVGTGFLIAPHAVATAAHVIASDIKFAGLHTYLRFPIAAVVMPGRHGVIHPPGHTLPSGGPAGPSGFFPFAAFSVSGSKAFEVAPEYTKSQASQFDYGLIRMKTGRRCTTIDPLFSAWPTDFWGQRNTRILADVKGFPIRTFLNQPARMAGYPGDQQGFQWESAGHIKEVVFGLGPPRKRFGGAQRHDTLYIDGADNRSGMSGSPVWAIRAGRRRGILEEPDQRVLLGMVSTCNGLTQAVLFTPFVCHRLQTWANQP